MKRVFAPRVELLYRAGSDCPLRAITHQLNGDPKPEWTFFTELQDALFCEWVLPCRIPTEMRKCLPGMESSVLATGPWHGVCLLLDEIALQSCRRDVPRFIDLLEFSLSHARPKWNLFINRKFVLRRSRPWHLPPPAANTPLAPLPCFPRFRPEGS